MPLSDDDITICSVYHSSVSKWLLELNYDAVKKMNPNTHAFWVIADNTPPHFADTLDKNKFQIVPGAQALRPVAPWIVISYSHAEAINSSLHYIKTRFAVVLDTDLYIVRKNWIQDVITHMQKNDLAFFGVPLHPVDFAKYRYFPSCRAFFIDRAHVDVSDLDFRPCFDWMMHPTWQSRLGQKISRMKHAVSKRSVIGTRGDTGFRIFSKFYRRATSECVTPVFVPSKDLAHIPEHMSVWEKILPDSLSYIPKQAGYFTERGFSTLGFPDARGQGWEEFMWHDTPFAFHVHAGTGKMQDEENRKQLRRILGGFKCLF